MSDQSHDQEPGGPLRGIRVLDLSNVIAGPLTTLVLGDFGADVIKIEQPDGGDPMRHHGPAKDGTGLFWKFMGRNKRSVAMYLGDPEVQEIVLDLVRTSDVLVENFRPGTLERWGLGWERLSVVNSGLILLRISGFGQTGPYATRPAFGTVAEVMSGLAHITGPEDGPPTLPPFGLADSIAGMAAVSALLMALREREVNGGSGQVVDVSILEPMMATMGFQIPWFDQLGIVETRRGNRSVNTAPRNTYLAGDGKWFAVAGSTNPIVTRLVKLVGRPELIEEPWFLIGRERAKHARVFDEAISSWAQQYTRDEIVQLGEEHNVAIAPVYDVSDLVADPQVKYREMITEIDDPDLGPLRMQSPIFRLTETPGRIRWAGPNLGQHTDEVLIGELGLTASRLASLRERGVVR